MTPQEAARALGGEVVGRKILCPGPGHSRTDRSLAVTFSETAPDGFTVHSFSTDDWQTCKDHVRSVLGIRREAVPVEFKETGQADTIKFALRIWEETRPIKGTPVEDYLRSRKIDPSALPSLRFHPRLKYDDRHYAGMVCLFRDIATDDPCGIHRTFLDGIKKIDRRMLGRAKGAAIKLDDDEDVCQGLHIGEGVETCLAARQMGMTPAWALGSADAIANFPVLSLSAITFLGERDKTGANERAIKKCAPRYVQADIEATLKWPVAGDMNTVIGHE